MIYRAGDQVGAWSYAALGFLGLGIAGISVVAVPLSLAWLVNSLWLGRKQEGMAAAANPPDLKSARVQGSTFKV